MTFDLKRGRAQIASPLLYALLALLPLSLLAPQPSHAQAKKEVLLSVQGYIYGNDKKLGGATVKLYSMNELLETVETKKSGKFNFKLNRDDYYTIEIIKDDFVTKRIAIYTNVPRAIEWIPDFVFDMDLVPYEKFKGVEISDLDFPSAMIAFDEDDEILDFNKTYNRNRKKTEQALLSAARKQK